MIHLALINLLRQRVRSLVTALGVAVAVGMLFLLLAFQRGYQSGLRTELDRLGAHLIVVPKGCPYDSASIALHGASWPCYLKSAYLTEVEHTPGVRVAAPVLMNAFFDPKTGGQSVYCGVTERILALRPGWRFAAGGFPKAPGGLLIGSELAKTRGWWLGQRVALPGIDKGSGTVAGILEPTQGPDDLFVYLPLPDAQRLFGRPGALTHILVRLDNPDTLDSVVSALRGCEAGLEMTVVPLAHLFETIQGLVRATRLLLGCIALAALLSAGAGVANTILMAVSERTREIGVLRAVGVSKQAVFGMIWVETLALCLAGSVLGIGLALLAATATESWLRGLLPYVPTDRLIAPELGTGLLCLAVGPVLGSLAALLPALRAAALSPALALKEVV
ncbi:ABC transporter permease [Armatimonas rosea]|uniref:Putative ABC transport system permease protein n=1 Tax=Armatimonas rosea TaxID=685828 RepID=A0A7W9SR84_ARMRO|nr:ABC transporter permease [Armatimonas rosea]MBB6051322.1 putative ABC transport system permease protein [Armatimonas rosea]